MASSLRNLLLLLGIKVIYPDLAVARCFGAIGEFGSVGRPGRSGIFAVSFGYQGCFDIFQAGSRFWNLNDIDLRGAVLVGNKRHARSIGAESGGALRGLPC